MPIASLKVIWHDHSIIPWKTPMYGAMPSPTDSRSCMLNGRISWWSLIEQLHQFCSNFAILCCACTLCLFIYSMRVVRWQALKNNEFKVADGVYRDAGKQQFSGWYPTPVYSCVLSCWSLFCRLMHILTPMTRPTVRTNLCVWLTSVISWCHEKPFIKLCINSSVELILIYKCLLEIFAW